MTVNHPEPSDITPSIEATVAAQFEDLRRYARMLTDSSWDADDLVQDTFVRALSSSLFHHPNPRAYLFRIAKNVWIDKKRRTTNGPIPLPENVSEEGDGITTGLLLTDAMAVLLTHLTPMQRVIFVLREALGYSAAQTADLLQMSVGAVKSMLHRARVNLHKKDTAMGDPGSHSGTRPGHEVQKDVLEAYLVRFRDHDVEGLVNLALQDVIEPIHAMEHIAHVAETNSKTHARVDRQRSLSLAA